MEKPGKTAALKCPFCGSSRVRRSRRRALVERTLLRFLWRGPFRCMDCYERFYIRPEGHPEPESHPEPADAQPAQPSVDANRPEPKPPEDRPNPKTNAKNPVNFSQVERRVFSRLPCKIPARVMVGSGSSVIGTLRDISLNGCFIETPSSVSVGNEIELSLEIKDGPQSRALVRRSVPSRGMGIEFTSMTVPNFRRLQTLAKNSVRLPVRP